MPPSKTKVCGTCKLHKSLKADFYPSSKKYGWFVCKSCIASRTHKSWLENRKLPMWHVLKKLRANFPKQAAATITKTRVLDLFSRFGDRSALSGRVVAHGEILNVARWDKSIEWKWDNVVPLTKSEMFVHTQHTLDEYPVNLKNHIDRVLNSSSSEMTSILDSLPPPLYTDLPKGDMEFALIKHYVTVFDCLPPWFLVSKTKVCGTCKLHIIFIYNKRAV